MKNVQPISARKAGEFCRLLEERGYGNNIFQKYFIENIEEIIIHLKQRTFNPNEIRQYWQKFYKDNFGIQIDLSNLEIPEPQGDFTWHIVTLQEVTEQMLYNKCEELFSCWKWTDKSLNDVLEPDRTTEGTHIALFRDRVEADEEFKNLSANMLKEKKIVGITLKQRLTMELDYFFRTGRHLDIQNITLCSGSRYVDGFIPGVGWGSVGMDVIGYGPDDRDDGLRFRQQF